MGAHERLAPQPPPSAAASPRARSRVGLGPHDYVRAVADVEGLVPVRGENRDPVLLAQHVRTKKRLVPFSAFDLCEMFLLVLGFRFLPFVESMDSASLLQFYGSNLPLWAFVFVSMLLLHEFYSFQHVLSFCFCFLGGGGGGLFRSLWCHVCVVARASFPLQWNLMR